MGSRCLTSAWQRGGDRHQATSIHGITLSELSQELAMRSLAHRACSTAAQPSAGCAVLEPVDKAIRARHLASGPSGIWCQHGWAAVLGWFSEGDLAVSRSCTGNRACWMPVPFRMSLGKPVGAGRDPGTGAMIPSRSTRCWGAGAPRRRGRPWPGCVGRRAASRTGAPGRLLGAA